MVGLEFIFHNRTPNKKRRAGRAYSWWPRVTLSLRKSLRGARCSGAGPRRGRGPGSLPGPRTEDRSAWAAIVRRGREKGPHPPPLAPQEGARLPSWAGTKACAYLAAPPRRARGQVGGAGREPGSGAQVAHNLRALGQAAQVTAPGHSGRLPRLRDSRGGGLRGVRSSLSRRKEKAASS